MNAVTHANKAE